MKQMETWTPLKEPGLLDIISKSYERMNLPQKKLWEAMKIEPKKWKLDPWGKEGNGFWVVAVFGGNAIWYNDIEEGFNQSSVIKFGILNDYFCNQDELEWTIQNILNGIKEGHFYSSTFENI